MREQCACMTCLYDDCDLLKHFSYED